MVLWHRLVIVIVLAAGLAIPVFSVLLYYFTPLPTQLSVNNYWGGYVVEGPQGSVSNVTGSWTVPQVNCGSTGSYLLVWVGIDGWGQEGQTVVQIGTRTDCVNGTPDYYPWYEFWPRQPDTIRIVNVTISPGDLVRASVSGDSSTKSFVMKIADVTKGTYSIARGEYQAAQLQGAEWVVEAPVLLNGTRFVMSDFSSVSFVSAFATISGQVRPLNELPAVGPTTVTELVYACPDGTVKVQPSNLVRAYNSFSMTWNRGGNC